jgi:hypothetical protein
LASAGKRSSISALESLDDDPVADAATKTAGGYTARNGDECVTAGQVRGRALGLENGGRFRSYSAGRTGACGKLDRLPLRWDRLTIDGRAPRTILFGRTATPGTPVTLQIGDDRQQATPGRGGGFLFVFSRPAELADVEFDQPG